MSSQTVLVLPRVEEPGLDVAFLAAAVWGTVPARLLVLADTGEVAGLPTWLRAAWSTRALHLHFRCTDPMPMDREYAATAPLSELEVVGAFLDPTGTRGEYMTVLVSPFGRVVDGRVENPHYREADSELDASWHCPGLRVRSWVEGNDLLVEMHIPFAGITPVIEPPRPGDRWTGNFFRIERQPIVEFSAWQPTYRVPIDLHVPSAFGVLEFGDGNA